MSHNQFKQANKGKVNSSKQDSFYIKHPINKRADAAWVLFQILENGRSASEVMPIVLQGLYQARNGKG